MSVVCAEYQWVYFDSVHMARVVRVSRSMAASMVFVFGVARQNLRRQETDRMFRIAGTILAVALVVSRPRPVFACASLYKGHLVVSGYSLRSRACVWTWTPASPSTKIHCPVPDPANTHTTLTAWKWRGMDMLLATCGERAWCLCASDGSIVTTGALPGSPVVFEDTAMCLDTTGTVLSEWLLPSFRVHHTSTFPFRIVAVARPSRRIALIATAAAVRQYHVGSKTWGASYHLNEAVNITSLKVQGRLVFGVCYRAVYIWSANGQLLTSLKSHTDSIYDIAVPTKATPGAVNKMSVIVLNRDDAPQIHSVEWGREANSSDTGSWLVGVKERPRFLVSKWPVRALITSGAYTVACGDECARLVHNSDFVIQ